MPGRLTTHVLDTALGKPASGLKVELFKLSAVAIERLSTGFTNDDGRMDQPLLQDASMQIGTFELRFHAGDYLRASGAAVSDPAFLDIVPIRFNIADGNDHYHVPLLLSAFGYSTYKGS